MTVKWREPTPVCTYRDPVKRAFGLWTLTLKLKHRRCRSKRSPTWSPPPRAPLKATLVAELGHTKLGSQWVKAVVFRCDCGAERRCRASDWFGVGRPTMCNDCRRYFCAGGKAPMRRVA
jgi:hypothetical protein